MHIIKTVFCVAVCGCVFVCANRTDCVGIRTLGIAVERDNVVYLNRVDMQHSV